MAKRRNPFELDGKASKWKQNLNQEKKKQKRELVIPERSIQTRRRSALSPFLTFSCLYSVLWTLWVLTEIPFTGSFPCPPSLGTSNFPHALRILLPAFYDVWSGAWVPHTLLENSHLSCSEHPSLARSWIDTGNDPETAIQILAAFPSPKTRMCFPLAKWN